MGFRDIRKFKENMDDPLRDFLADHCLANREVKGPVDKTKPYYPLSRYLVDEKKSIVRSHLSTRNLC